MMGHLGERVVERGFCVCFILHTLSPRYQVHHNFFVYGGHKSDFDGHGKVSYGNLNAYSYVYEVVCASISSLPLATPDGHMNEGYYNNT